MPIYEYSCQDCKQLFEDWQKDYEEREIPCPVCGGNASRLISSTSFVLKGGGWYASGYNSPGAAAGVAETAKPQAAEGAPASPASPACKTGASEAAPAATPAPATPAPAKPCAPCAASPGSCSSTSS